MKLGNRNVNLHKQKTWHWKTAQIFLAHLSISWPIGLIYKPVKDCYYLGEAVDMRQKKRKSLALLSTSVFINYKKSSSPIATGNLQVESHSSWSRGSKAD